MNLTEFLLARIAEDEATARTAAHQKVAGPFIGNWHPDSAFLMAVSAVLDRPEREHMARHDPARVLAEVEAKRQIVETADAAEQAFDVGADLHLHQTGRIGAYRRVLSLLALPYADHPDYRDEWKP